MLTETQHIIEIDGRQLYYAFLCSCTAYLGTQKLLNDINFFSEDIFEEESHEPPHLIHEEITFRCCTEVLISADRLD